MQRTDTDPPTSPLGKVMAGSPDVTFRKLADVDLGAVLATVARTRELVAGSGDDR